MTPEETTETISRIFDQINNLDRKLTTLETNVETILHERGTLNGAIEELKTLFGDLKLDIGKLQTPFHFETCGGYKELRDRLDVAEDRINAMEQRWTEQEKKHSFKLTIAASVISGLLVILIIALFVLVVPYIGSGGTSTDQKLERLIEALEKDKRSNP